ncbi:MAG: BON domain-containing protein [Gammaproteobacteria bacterium]
MKTRFSMLVRPLPRTLLLGTAIAVFAVTVSGCVAVAAGGAVTGAAAANDRRTTGTFVEDQAIELKAANAIMAEGDLARTVHINVTSYNQIALVTGEAPTAELKQKVLDIVSATAKVRQVYDEIEISAPSALVSRASDVVITGKVKTALLGLPNYEGTRVKVVTERGIVYLLGLVSQADADRAAETARNIGGVQKVVKLFETPGG